MQTVKDYFNRFKAWSKKRIKHAIVWVAAVGIVLYGLLVDAFNKARELSSKALHSAKHWSTTRCFPWIKNAYYSIDYAFSRAWRLIKIQIPSWREIRAPLTIGLAVIAAIYIPQAFQSEPKPPPVGPYPSFTSQGLHIGPQVDLSGLESSEDAIGGALGISGDYYFVSVGGSNANDCSSWEDACATIQHVIDNHVTADNGDSIFLGSGEYDTGQEVLIDKGGLTIAGASTTSIIENNGTVNGSAVLNITAGNVTIRDVAIFKDEFASLNSYGIYLDSVGTINLKNIRMVVPPNPTHTGIFVENGDGIVLDNVSMSGFLQLGVGVVFSNTVRSGIFGDLSGIARLSTGILFTSGTDEIAVAQSVQVASCSVGVQFDLGVTSNSVNAYITDTPIEVVDNSGNGSNTLRGSLTSLRTATEHSGEMFPGTFYVVDGSNGLDTNNGRSPDEAVATIGRALELISPGDGLVIRADGVYSENIVIDVNAIQIFAAPGVVISGTGTTTPTITVTGDNVWFRRQMDILASGVGICIEANNVRMDDVTVNAATIAFDVDGNNVVLNNTRAAGYSVAGYDISGEEPDVFIAHAGGDGTTTIGYVISSTVTGGTFRELSSVQNTTTGFSVTLGATNNIFVDCTSGTGDGDRFDPNLTNMWSNYVDTQSRWRHEHNWPSHGGQGVAADPFTVDNEATDDTPVARDDLNYWGDTVALIDPYDIDVSWRALGIEVIAGTANKNAEWQIFYPTPSASAARNGGNLWDLGETILTINSAFTFEVDDRVWINSTSDPNGEIAIVTNVAGNVITIATETRASGNTGLRYNHAGNERMYLVERPGNEAWHGTEGIYSAASAKTFDTIYFSHPKENQADSGAVMRLLNGSDALAFTVDVKMKYEATKEHD
jgi:hypothetical protein